MGIPLLAQPPLYVQGLHGMPCGVSCNMISIYHTLTACSHTVLCILQYVHMHTHTHTQPYILTQTVQCKETLPAYVHRSSVAYHVTVTGPDD